MKMRYPDLNQDKELSSVEPTIQKYLKWMLRVAVAVFVIWLLGLVFTKKDVGDFGTIGDYFGGMLNPFFAFMAFLLLSHSIRLQLKEMSETRKALQETSAETRRAAEAQEQSVRAQRSLAKLQRENHEIQNNILVLQKEMLDFDRESQMIKIFERSFYNLLEDLKVVKGDMRFDFDVPYDEGIDEHGIYFEAGIKKYSLGFEQTISYLIDSVVKDDLFKDIDFKSSREKRQFFVDFFYRNFYNNCYQNFFLAMDTVVHQVYQMIVMVHESEFLSDELKVFYISFLKKSFKGEHKVWILLHSLVYWEFDLTLYKKYSFFVDVKIAQKKSDLFLILWEFYKESIPE